MIGDKNLPKCMFEINLIWVCGLLSSVVNKSQHGGIQNSSECEKSRG